MEVNVLSKEKNTLLSRVEVHFLVSYDEGATPPRDKVRDELAKILKVKREPVVIDHIRTEFGKREAKGYAKVYDTLEDATRVERKHILERNRVLEQKVEEEKGEE